MKFHKSDLGFTWISDRGRDRLDRITWHQLLEHLKNTFTRYPDHYESQFVWSYDATEDELSAEVKSFLSGR